MMKRMASTLLVLCLVCILFTGCKKEENITISGNIASDKNGSAEVVNYDKLTDIASNSDWVMKYNPEQVSVEIYDVETGVRQWSTAVDESYYGQEIKNNLIRAGIRQLVTVAYTNFSGVDANVNNLDASCKTVLREIENGIRFDFDFTEIDIQLSLEITLEDNVLKARIPMKTLKENGEYGVTRIDVLPMVGATTSTDEGYFFFPDGCGAIYKFDAYMDTQKTVSMDVYDSMITEIKSEGSTENNSNICIHVFGINQGDKGVFAHIIEGEENCSINLASDKSTYAVNRLYSSIRVRKQYAIETASGDTVYTYQKSTSIGDFEIYYHFLEEDCSYSDMANVYREYLYETGRLTQLEEAPELAVDFLISTNKKEMIGSKSIVSTTFKEADNILSDLNENGSYKIATVLYGWEKGGYYSYPNKSKLVSGAGSKKELEELAKKHNIYLLCNYTDAMTDNSGFSKQTDVVYGVSGNPLTDLEESRYLLNPSTQIDRFEKDLKIVKETNTNVAFEKFGKTLYEDFNKNHALSRYGYKNVITEYLKSAEKSAKVATDGYLAYMSGNTDYILNLTDDTSNLFIWEKEVPFLQMVLHGSIPYSSALPGNLASDITATKLKWMEYGYIPTFILTGNDESLIGSNYDKLFSSEYDNWEKTIRSLSDEMKEVYKELSDQYMVQHEIEDQVAHVVWSNGTEFVINHNDFAVEYLGTEIEGQNYLVIKNTK